MQQIYTFKDQKARVNINTDVVFNDVVHKITRFITFNTQLPVLNTVCDWIWENLPVMYKDTYLEICSSIIIFKV